MITKNVRAFSLAIGLGVASSLICATDVFAATFRYDDTLSGKTNLYYDNWGHGHDQPFVFLNTDFPSPLQTGVAPVAFDGGRVFSANQNVNIRATGCVIDSGNSCTPPDGRTTAFQTFHNSFGYSGPEYGTLHKHHAFSAIGIWSSTSDRITPIELGADPSFQIGYNIDLTTPDHNGPIYLFLGENDSNFNDNPADSKYDIIVTTQTNPGNNPGTGTSVPEPSSLLGMFGVASLAMFFRKRL